MLFLDEAVNDTRQFKPRKSPMNIGNSKKKGPTHWCWPQTFWLILRWWQILWFYRFKRKPKMMF
jgi:hypothetical protein